MNTCTFSGKTRYTPVLPVILLALLLVLAGCASNPARFPGHLEPVAHGGPGGSSEPGAAGPDPAAGGQEKLPALRVADWDEQAGSRWAALGIGDSDTELSVDSMPLNRFIQVALGEVLGMTFIVDPAVQGRLDPVTLRVSSPLPAKAFLDTVEQLLAGYDVGLSMESGTLEVLPAGKMQNIAPTFLGPRAKIAMQQGKIMMILPLQYSSVDDALRFARFFIPPAQGTTVDTLRRINALLVIGDAAKVARFRSVVRMVDRPTMAERELEIFRPVYWQAGEMIELLKDALKTQGVLIAENAEDPGIYLSEIKQLNSLIVAAPDEAILAWIEDWIETLDTPKVAGDALRSFVYPVKFSTANELGKVVSEVLGGLGSRGSEGSPAEGEKQGGAGASVISGEKGLRMVIDEPHNSLVFVGSAQSYKAVYQLLEQIDVPAKQVLLEVTVADVTLENNTQLGIEWRFQREDSNDRIEGVGSTIGGVGVGGGGFTYTAFDDIGNIRARLNALAVKGDARILSSPRLLAVDNEEARIQVGTQIAVISSENTADSVDGIIRSFNYVDTGVILSFTPTVMSGEQVRLQVSQEVSVPGASANNTPPINTRSVQTTLIAQSGSTIMIGGLISSTDTKSSEQVPVLGDIPVLGSLFRGREVVDNSTEMVVLITPHIIESSAQLEALTEAFREQIRW